MKKITILILSVIAIAAAYPLFAAQDFGFSDPIPVVGDNPNDPGGTSAVRMYFFNHPAYTGDSNFSSSYEIDKKVSDVIAVPGSVRIGEPTAIYLPAFGYDKSNMPKLKSTLGLGPRNLTLKFAEDKEITRYLVMRPSTKPNRHGRSVVLADIRKTKSGEYQSLSLGNDRQYIGYAGNYIAPYLSASGKSDHPALFKSASSAYFKWCSRSNNMGIYFECAEEDTIEEIDDILAYDLVPPVDASLMITPVFDPLQIHVGGTTAERGYLLKNGQSTKGFYALNAATTGAEQRKGEFRKGEFNFALISPLSFFYKGNYDKYRFLGYSSLQDYVIDMTAFPENNSSLGGLNPEDWFDLLYKKVDEPKDFSSIFMLYSLGLINLPYATANTVSSETRTAESLQTISDIIAPAYITNPWFPVAANPVAVVRDSSQDVATLYYNTLFSWNDFLLTPYGRPTIFKDMDVHRMKELVGFKKTDGSFTSLEDWSGYEFFYPSKVVVPVVIWGVGDVDIAQYETSNPSSIITPKTVALVDYGASSHPGIFNMAHLQDRSRIPKDYLLLPSSIANNRGFAGMIYVIDKNDTESQLHMKSWKWTEELGNADDVRKRFALRPREEIYTEIPFRVPSKAIMIPPYDGDPNVVPYQLATGNLDGDSCQDIVVSYRSAEMVTDIPTKNYTDFHVSYPNLFSIIFRSPLKDGSCPFSTSDKYWDPDGITVVHKTLPILGGNTAGNAAVSAVSIGNFVGELGNKKRNDIAVGNLNLEKDADGNFAGFVYVFANSEDDIDRTTGKPIFSSPNTGYDPTTGIGAIRIKAGFKSHPDSTDKWGVGYLTTDSVSVEEYDNIGAISGLPLILPSLACPVSGSDTTRAVSVHEGMLATLYARMSESIGCDEIISANENNLNQSSCMDSTHKMEYPFQKFGMPLPQRCAPREGVCGAGLVEEATNYKLPLWSDIDCPTQCSKWENLCLLSQMDQNLTSSSEPYMGLGGNFCMVRDDIHGQPLNPMAYLCMQQLNAVREPVNKQDSFAYLTDLGGIADGSQTENAFYYFAPLFPPDEETSLSVYSTLFTGNNRYAPITFMDNLVNASNAWTFYLPSTASAQYNPTYPERVQPFPSGAAGCSLLPPSQQNVVSQDREMSVPFAYDFLDPKMPLEDNPLFNKISPPSGSQAETTYYPSTIDYKKIPLIKGREMPGPREMTVILGAAAPCGNGSVDVYLGEQCDPIADDPSSSCKSLGFGDSSSCNANCMCSGCGDGTVDSNAGEECDLGSENFSDTDRDGCRTGCKLHSCGDEVVDSDEQCEGNQTQEGSHCDPDKCQWVSNTCGDGIFSQDATYSEECDYSAGEEGACKTAGFECSQSCICEPICGDNIVAGAEVCDGTAGCQSGYTCNEECSVCEKVPVCGDGTVDPGETCGELGLSCAEGFECIAQGQPNACTCTPVPDSFSSDCEVKCVSFADEAEKLYYDSLNETYFRAPSGRKDDFFCPNNSVIQMSCLVADAAFNGSVGPWMMVQSKGMVLHDMAKITSSDFPFDVVAPQSPIRIAPLASSASSGGKAAAVVLPNLASIRGNLEFSTSGVSPMAATSVMESTAGIMTINNMIEHRAVALMPSSSKSQSRDAGKAAAAPAVHYTRLRAYPEPTHTTIESWPKDLDPEKLYVENRLKPDYVRSIIETRKKEGAKGTRDIALGISDDVGIYEMSILQETYGEKSSGTTAVNYSFYAGPVSSISEGGAGCGKCSISENSGFNARAATPILLAVLLSALALGAVRVRVSVRSKRK
ncbi:MAG: DUF4215 domain-containing protein [Myxococcales bacterium]|nr:DUF4215 domain-containing protein [Myxococcales bacterium]